MAETPERIWATSGMWEDYVEDWSGGEWNPAKGQCWNGEAMEVGYVREDIHQHTDSLLDEAVAVLEMVAGKIHPGDDKPGDTFADFTGEQTDQIYATLAKIRSKTE